MPAQEALSETEQMTAASVSAALSAMKPEQAAQLVQVVHPSVSCFGSLLAHCAFQPTKKPLNVSLLCMTLCRLSNSTQGKRAH